MVSKSLAWPGLAPSQRTPSSSSSSAETRSLMTPQSDYGGGGDSDDEIQYQGHNAGGGGGYGQQPHFPNPFGVGGAGAGAGAGGPGGILGGMFGGAMGMGAMGGFMGMHGHGGAPAPPSAFNRPYKAYSSAIHEIQQGRGSAGATMASGGREQVMFGGQSESVRCPPWLADSLHVRVSPAGCRVRATGVSVGGGECGQGREIWRASTTLDYSY